MRFLAIKSWTWDVTGQVGALPGQVEPGGASDDTATATGRREGMPTGALDAGRVAGRGASPPVNNMGAEFAVHWLTLTVERPGEWSAELLERRLGVTMERLGYGGQGYRESWRDLVTGARVYGGPAMLRDWETRSTISLPGRACEWLGADGLRELLGEVELFADRVRCTRIDLAWDHACFRPAELWAYLQSGGKVRTDAKRSTFRHIEDIEGVGTVYLGSRQSQRMLRVYDRGEVCRVELECKSDRAHAVLSTMMEVDTAKWSDCAWSHLLDYVELPAVWWQALCQAVGSAIVRAGLTLGRRSELTLKRAENWLRLQAGPILAVYTAIRGRHALMRIAYDSRPRLGRRHRALLAALTPS